MRDVFVAIFVCFGLFSEICIMILMIIKWARLCKEAEEHKDKKRGGTMTGDEMMEKLGYEKKVDSGISVQYKKIDEDGECYIIELDLKCDTIGKYLITNKGWEIVEFDIEEIPVVLALIQDEY